MKNSYPKRYNRLHRLLEAFGEVEEYELTPDVPKKIGSSAYSRLEVCKGECTYCFPHGSEMPNHSQLQKNWKKFRKTQYKT